MRLQQIAKLTFFVPVGIFLGCTLILWSMLLTPFFELLMDDITPFLSWEWDPSNKQFGILPMMVSSLCIASLTTSLAFVWSLGLSLFLHSLGPQILCRLLSFLVRAMASVPAILFGLAGVLYVVPMVRSYSQASGYSLVATVVVLGFFLVPFQTKLCLSAFGAADEKVGYSAELLGFSSWQKLIWVILPESRKALLAGIAMSFGRSLGDTMIALLVSGNSPHVPSSLFSPTRALTAHIALVASTDAFSRVFDSLYVVVAILLCCTVGTNLLSTWFIERKV